MSINLSTLQGLTIPEGVVTQITDASGRVLWVLSSGGKIVLGVEKITSNTYVSSTSYTSEQFILLDIYPKTASSKVYVTFGGLTKTLTFTSTDAQKVYFGTYGGVADSVSTPASGELTIEGDCIGVGASSFNTAKNSTTRCKCITSFVEWGGIEQIPSGAAAGCTGLTSVTIGNGVIDIGSSAFSSCTGLTSAIIGNRVTSIGSSAFYGCSSLTSITIPDGVTSVGSEAFEGCTGLTSVTLGNGALGFGNDAFNECTNLTSVYVPDLEKWLAIRFGSTRANPLWYAKYLYVDNKLVTDLIIPDGITATKFYAFAGYTGLKSVIIPDSVTIIDGYTFGYCANLTDVTIGNGVTSIEQWAFVDCTSLKSIIIPNNVTSLGVNGAFSGCTGLTSVTLGNGVTNIPKYTFDDCTSLKSIIIPNNVTSIEPNAFRGCTGLASVTFGNTSGWYVVKSGVADATEIAVDVTNAANNATLIRDTYAGYAWHRS